MQRRHFTIIFVLLALVVALTGCATDSLAGPSNHLAFSTRLEFPGGRAATIKLGVSNDSDSAFPGDRRFEGQMTLRGAATDGVVASAGVMKLPAINANEVAWVGDWQGQLIPGTYTLTWGAEGYDTIHEELEIVERNGQLQLANSDTDQVPESVLEPATVVMPDEPLDMARADLAEGLDIDNSAITLVSATSTEFPDASLDVPEPGMTYAQVIVPSYILELKAGDEIYTYHAGNDGIGWRVVAVPDVGTSSEAVDATSEPPVYVPVVVPNTFDADLPRASLEVPADWVQCTPEMVWTPVEESDLRLGLNVIALEPPMEPEAVLLLDSFQTLASTPVDVVWAQGRRIDLEVFGDAPTTEGAESQAPVVAVETHVLLTLEVAGDHLGVDLYASAPDAEQLATLQSALDHALSTLRLLPGDTPPAP